MNEQPGSFPSSSVDRTLNWAACVFMGCVLLGYAGLLTLGRWQLDEYVEFFRMRTEPAFLLRRLKWSPRPLSETLYCTYGWLVNHLHHAFLVPFLGLLWVVFLVAGLFTCWQNRHTSDREGLRSNLLVALTLMALFLAGGHATEVFFWPAGAVAYLPTLGATLLLFFQVVDGRLTHPTGRLIACICLLVAAGSSEAGAGFTLCYACLQGTRQLRSGRKPFLWYLLPLVLALAVVVAARMNRFHPAEASASSTAGHPIASLKASVAELTFEAIGRTALARAAKAHPHPAEWIHAGVTFPLQIVAHSRIPMDFLLVSGIALGWSRRSRPRRDSLRHMADLVIALLLASFLTAEAASFSLGNTCCERHELLRESWLTMSLVAGGIVLSVWIAQHRSQWQSRHGRFAPVLLCLAVLTLGFDGPLARTYRVYGVLSRANAANFASGFDRQKSGMSFEVLPSVGIVSEEPIPTGTYQRPPVIQGFGYDVFRDYLMGFFDKQSIAIHALDVGQPVEPGPDPPCRLHAQPGDCPKP